MGLLLSGVSHTRRDTQVPALAVAHMHTLTISCSLLMVLELKFSLRTAPYIFFYLCVVVVVLHVRSFFYRFLFRCLLRVSFLYFLPPTILLSRRALTDTHVQISFRTNPCDRISAKENNTSE